jgi:hypothetical protein
MEEPRKTMAGNIIVAAKGGISHEVPFKDALLVSLVAGLSYCFDSYAVNIYGLLLPVIAVSLGAGTGLMGLIGSIFLVGYTIGTIGFRVAAELVGRKDTLGVSVLLYGATTALGGLGHNIPFFAAMRGTRRTRSSFRVDRNGLSRQFYGPRGTSEPCNGQLVAGDWVSGSCPLVGSLGQHESQEAQTLDSPSPMAWQQQ